jgi:multiple sugar transport system ATP-binding protein
LTAGPCCGSGDGNARDPSGGVRNEIATQHGRDEMASISLDGVGKIYPNGFEAVKNLDLHIEDGELLVVVGPSGCGKTSVLRMIAGLESVTSGTIRIGDEVVNDVSPKDRDIAMIFQSYALYPNMNVAQNIGFALRMKKFSKVEIDRRVKAAAAVLGITDWLGQKPTQLSGGQRQRVAMGRAIVREPSAFLMDEPLSNLDAKLRVQMRAEVARVQKRIGVATLFVTHDQTEAMTLGHRVAVLRSGVLQQCDTPQVLYDRPVNIFVAGFIGSPAMNLLESALSSDGTILTIGSQTIKLPSSLVSTRPEDLSVATGDQTKATLNCDVELVEALGSELLVHFRTDAKIVSADAPLNAKGDEVSDLDDGSAESDCVARVDPRNVVRAGERTSLEFSCDRLEFFDPSSGLAIWE